MKPKRLIIELVVLVAIYLVSFFCWHVIFSQFYSSSPLAIPNETYAITQQSPPQIFVFLTACVIGTIVYFVRAAVNRYKSNVTNFILLTCNCFSVVALCLLGIFLEQHSVIRGDVLSVQFSAPLVRSPSSPKTIDEHSLFANYFMIPAYIFLFILILSTTFTVKNRKTNTHAQTAI